MGMDRTILYPGGSVPSWEAIREQLQRVGEAGTIRMIDGLPAFPDENPEPGWKEIRVGLSAGMVTLRAGSDRLVCVVWGNADAAMRTAWDKLCWAAAVGGGVVETPAGPIDAAEFARSVGLHPA